MRCRESSPGCPGGVAARGEGRETWGSPREVRRWRVERDCEPGVCSAFVGKGLGLGEEVCALCVQDSRGLGALQSREQFSPLVGLPFWQGTGMSRMTGTL